MSRHGRPAELTGGPAHGPTRLSTQERIIRAGTALFAEQGFDVTSVQAVVEAAGVTKGALYYYLSSKDDLLHAIH